MVLLAQAEVAPSLSSHTLVPKRVEGTFLSCASSGQYVFLLVSISIIVVMEERRKNKLIKYLTVQSNEIFLILIEVYVLSLFHKSIVAALSASQCILQTLT